MSTEGPSFLFPLTRPEGQHHSGRLLSTGFTPTPPGVGLLLTPDQCFPLRYAMLPLHWPTLIPSPVPSFLTAQHVGALAAEASSILPASPQDESQATTQQVPLLT